MTPNRMLPFLLLFAGGTMMAQQSFNGLGMGLGTLSGSHMRKRAPSARRISLAKKAKREWRPKAQGPRPHAIWDRGGRSLLGEDQAKRVLHPGRYRRPGRHPANVDDPERPLALCILRIYWDGETAPSVEAPMGDFFANGWCQFAPIVSLPVCVNPGSAFNCYWEMPFRKSCKITVENIAEEELVLYYQINYTLTDIPDDAAYFHAQFRRVNPLPYKQVYTILDGVKGWGHYVGTYMAWGVNNNGWWGEGEIKFYMDGDTRFPTICGTGTEDYFCGSYGFENPKTKQYHEFTTPYAGLPQVIRPDGLGSNSQQRFGLYRWHIMDPVRFEKDLRVTMQARVAIRRALPATAG